MEYLDYPFRVSTGSGRRPTPLTYEHLRKWIEAESHVFPITSIEELTNINQYLEQQATLYISNILQQVIAQIIGEHDGGFVTIKGTQGGALHIYPAGGSEDGKIDVLLAAGTNTIGNVKIEGTTQEHKSKAFHVNTSPTSTIIPADGTKSHHITSIMFTVAAENDITFNDEGSGLSGAMNFGGTGEPMGLTHNFGILPLVCAAGKKFEFDLSQAQYVTGLVTYYSE